MLAWTRPAPATSSLAQMLETWFCTVFRLSTRCSEISALVGAHLPGRGRGLLARRSLSDSTQRAYYRVFAPADTPLEEAVHAAGRRWSIEQGFERAKGEVSLD